MVRCIWDLEDDPRGNVHHISKHGSDIEDVDEVDDESIYVVTAFIPRKLSSKRDL
jgi:hypothetical protein